ncbi:MAG: sulfurtransferase TusA [Gammaproteobacteria bacterium]|jgi:tRNA 2-thiouridine synthesizing protein A|nr:sulfurtransferase TusA [Gammaproteobacteria bacterium]MBT3859478.1 sulfurtransferase TusA [Gammaproteobacteria bacterium]MBT3986628.1 sulfurtransferase TusA [Gammaproteobacteria bacterium]MBT4255747.1 sulfurtransferase TusA [Gammaproteobacteria bacterium]MBT4581379.1 sulfurtransferase TusA [Gammaproteobacteria bacterium]
MSDSKETHSNLDIGVDLDACGLFCPEPVMLLHNKIRDISVGDLLRLTATDPSTTRDVPKFCLFLGHDLVEQKEEEGKYVYLIRKNEQP